MQQQQLGLFASRITLLRVHSEQLSRRVDLHLALGGTFESTVVPRVASLSAIAPAPNLP